MTDAQHVPEPLRESASARDDRARQVVIAPSFATFSGLANEHMRANGWQPTVAQLADWNALFTAVKVRLRSIATTPDLYANWPGGDARRHPVAEGVLDCVGALEQLHSQLVCGLGGLGFVAANAASAVAGPAVAAAAPADAAYAGSPGAPAAAAASPEGEPSAGFATGRVQATDVLAWMPGEAFLRRRIACDASQGANLGEGFALLRLEFPALDVRRGERRLLDAVAQPAGSVAMLDAPARTRRTVRDALLIAIAARLRGALKRQDVITRLSPDEFCCLLIGASSPEALSNYVSRVVSAVSLPFAVEGEQWMVRPVFGVSCFPDDGTTADELLRFASTAQNNLSWWRKSAAVPEQGDGR